MDKLDCQILSAIQNDFPLCQKPYEKIAHKLNIPTDRLLKRIKKLMSKGIIRRFGFSFDSPKLGFCTTLIALSVKPPQVKKAAKIIEQFPEITHSYLRKDDFNIWFTIIAVDKKRIDHILETICSALSLDDSKILNLPMKRLFKLDTRFNVPVCRK